MSELSLHHCFSVEFDALFIQTNFAYENVNLMTVLLRQIRKVIGFLSQ